MSLLLLFSSNQPFAQDYGQLPISVEIMDNTPSLSIVGVFDMPILAYVDSTNSMFTTTTTTYNQADVQYNSVDQVYAGSDRNSYIAPEIYSVGNI